MDRQKLLNNAHNFGAEARANNRAMIMTKDDREDLMFSVSMSNWGDIPEDLRQGLQAAFVAGYESESKNYI
ncbi:hypothetical protein FNW02_33440 [Komarekiella sp. 'clone 1']|uniref:Uncharacterized protein n=1 Tax=Komarekiella delphini-convector SJRDD-AB1 TaxID=2593771 RepID=A0AA40VUT5_9NOST|nr:hypothetical protein [Komarekiella delphini-convector]MBD6620549.1 hypothetical protein [Komarekiella delphini-convector SJRDD-AB1]